MIASGLVLAGGGSTAAASSSTRPGPVDRVSVATSGVQADDVSYDLDISADGRYVVFTSLATTLVDGDTNGLPDVFLRDRRTGRTTRVNLSSAGAQADDHSFSPAISPDGRYVAFVSRATNLVPGDTNGIDDVYVRDLRTGTTQRASVSSTGVPGDGSVVGGFSGDGRYLAFASVSANLVPDDTNNDFDVFVRDLRAGTTTRISLTDTDGQADSGSGVELDISRDGRYVAFISNATNLVAGDTNQTDDVFVRDRRTGTTTRVSVSSTGTESNDGHRDLSLSADGRYVAFVSYGSTLVPGDTNTGADVFVHDRRTGMTSAVSDVTLDSRFSSAGSSVSGDGRYVAYHSTSPYLVPGDTNETTDLFVLDRRTGVVARVCQPPEGWQSDGYSVYPTISPDGRWIAFGSAATNLVAGDTNAVEDVFVCRRT